MMILGVCVLLVSLQRVSLIWRRFPNAQRSLRVHRADSLDAVDAVDAVDPVDAVDAVNPVEFDSAEAVNAVNAVDAVNSFHGGAVRTLRRLFAMYVRKVPFIVKRYRCDSQVPIFVDEVARRLRGGLGIVSALSESSSTMEHRFRVEFASCVNDLRLGVVPSEAIHRWATASRSAALRALATVVAVGEATGGVHPRALDDLVTVLRDHEGARGMAQVHAAQARLSATVLGVAPFVFCALLVLGDERASQFMWHTTLGRITTGLGVLLDVIGAAWILRASKGVLQ
jgi:hypothetical protein